MDEQKYKIKLINDIIIKSGVKSPPANSIIDTIHSKFNESSIETIKRLCAKYDIYILTSNISNFGTETKYISKQNKIIDFDSFIFGDLYSNDFPMPKTNLTNALFGERDFFDLYDKFLEVDEKIQHKRKQALVKFDLLKKEKNYEKSKT